MGFHYDINRRWSDQYLPSAKEVIAHHLLKAAPDPMDLTEATDLVAGDVRRIAFRMRRPGYAERYAHQFTIRSRLPSGTETELSKIINGHGDWMFYGHASRDGQAIEKWMLVDLRAFRAALIRRDPHELGTGEIINVDGTAFRWFDVRSFPPSPPIVVAASHAGMT